MTTQVSQVQELAFSEQVHKAFPCNHFKKQDIDKGLFIPPCSLVICSLKAGQRHEKLE